MNKISIITATYNAGKTLESLIQSIIIQDSDNFEFIIVDGCSKDNTMDIINKYRNYITEWISEPDKGIYDAWNKGVLRASGDWIMFLGADDILLPTALSKYQNFLAMQSNLDSLEYVSSKRQMIDLKGKIIRTGGFPWQWPLFLKEMTVSHPGSLHSKKKLFDIYGVYDIRYRICGDYELLLRAKDKLNAAFMDEVTVKMSEGGASDSIAAITEHFQAATETGGASYISSKFNECYYKLKFVVKNCFRKIGLNVYLKK